MATDTAEIRFFIVLTKVMEGENVFTSIKRTPVVKISSLVAFECVKTHPQFKPCRKNLHVIGRCKYVLTFMDPLLF